MNQAQADNNALFFLTLFLVWFGYHWFFVADFPGMSGVKRYQLTWRILVDRLRRRKHYKVCALHATYLRPGELGTLDAARCSFCKWRRRPW